MTVVTEAARDRSVPEEDVVVAALEDPVVDPATFRRTLGQFATGVVVAAALDAGGRPHGMAANSFTSVSLDPPLVALCADHRSSTWPRLRETGHFAVSILGAEQEDVCRTFARKGVDRFADLTWTTSPAGDPVIDGALAWLDCTIDVLHPAGDHELVLARVRGLGVAGDGPPLVFFRGAYGRIAP